MLYIKRLLIVLLLSCSSAWGAIAASGTAAVCTETAATNAPVVTRTSSAGNTVVIVVSISGGGTLGNVTGITNDTYASRIAISNGGSSRVEIWSTSAGGAGGSSSATVNLDATVTRASVCEFEYTGVLGLGVTASSTAGAANPSQSLTTVDNNNWCVGGFADNNGTLARTTTALTGSLRAKSDSAAGSTQLSAAIVDNGPIASPGTCTTAVTNAGSVWALATLELKTVAVSAGGNSTRMLRGVGK